MPTNAAVVWWLYGPPCVGKSTTAWELYTHLLPGQPRAFFDVDQVGICYPEPEADPGRYRLKARTAGALVRRFVQSGARTVIVSGVVNEESLQQFATQLDGVPVVYCRLHVRSEELRRRLQERYGADQVAGAIAEARHWDRHDRGHVVVDAGSGRAREVARRVLEAIGDLGTPPATPMRMSSSHAPPMVPAASARPGRAVLVCGPTAVGKSTLGYGLFTRLLQSGRASAYVDLQQIGFITSTHAEEPVRHHLTAACVTDLWKQYRAVGAQELVLAGQVERSQDVMRYRTALDETPLLVCRLRADRHQLRHRIVARTRSEGPPLAGDRLAGRPADQVVAALELAQTQQAQLERAGIGDVVLDTTNLSVDGAVHRLSALLQIRAADDGQDR